MMHKTIILFPKVMVFLWITSFLLCGHIPSRAGEVPGPEIHFETIRPAQGLPTDELFCVYQDREGYMWFGTADGFCRWDGYQMKVYKSNYTLPNLLPHNWVNCILEDSDSNLWIGSQFGLAVMDKTTGIIQHINQSVIFEQTINCILEISDHEIWFGTENGIVKGIRKNGSFEILPAIHNMNGGVKCMMKDALGDVWVGTWPGGVSRYSAREKKMIDYPALDKDDIAMTLFQDKDENIWIGTWSCGLYRMVNPYDPNHCRYEAYTYKKDQKNSLLSNTIFSIAQDDVNGYLWVGTYKGLCLLTDIHDPHSFIRYDSSGKREFSNNDLRSIYKDKAGVMWLAFSGDGVKKVQISDNIIRNIPLDKLYSEFGTNSINSIYEYPQGTLWLGTKGQGIIKYDIERKTFERLFGDQQLGERMNTISSLTQFPGDRRIWATSYYSGMYSIDPLAKNASGITNMAMENTPAFFNDITTVLFRDKDRNLWIGGRGLIIMNEQDTLTIRYINDNSTYNGGEAVSRSNVTSVFSIIQDRKERIWLGSENDGLYQVSIQKNDLSTIKFKNYNSKNGLTNNNTIQQVYEDQQGRIWIGTRGGGISLYDEDKDCFHPVDFISDFGDVIMSIQEDAEGNLWFSTNLGIVKYSPNLTDRMQRRFFSSNDGIQDNFFIRGSSYKRANGDLFFGGNNGISYFKPEMIRENDYLPRMVLTDFKIFNNSIETLPEETRCEISSKLPNYSGEVTLRSDQNNFTIEFAGLSYFNPEKNQYAYKLEGIDRDWQYTDSKRRYANYRNIPYGEYQFSLVASNNSGLWNNEPKTLKIIVLPPFYLTWWAKAIYVILGLALIYIVISIIRNRINTANAIKLQRMENAQIKELNRSKLEFFTNVSHEFLTPLTILSCAVDDLQKSDMENAETFGIMKRNTLRLMRLLQQILEFRKAETGNLKLKVTYGNIKQFINSLCVENFKLLSESKKIGLYFDADEGEIDGWFDSDKLDKIVYNLMSNAFKYNVEGGRIDVKLRVTPDFIIVSIRNTGEGIPGEKLPDLFKRFYEGNYRKFKVQGTGIGLSLTRELVNLHPQGEINVTSEVGKFTEFTFKLPISRQYFDDNQLDESYINLPESVADVKPDAEVEDIQEKPTLLIVEDNPDLQKVMKGAFRAKYNVVIASDGQQGLDMSFKHNPHIILSDIMMPNMDGYEMTKILKSDIRTSHIPIVMLTAKVDKQSKIEGYNLGADLYISKPFDLDILEVQVGSLLNNRRKAANAFGSSFNMNEIKSNFTTLDEQFMKKAVQVIEENLSDTEFDMVVFQDKMASTSSMMYRKFKALTGMPPFEFVKKMRLEAAAEIMKEKKGGTAEMAYAVGFNDPKYFSKSFRKMYGVSPGDYMKAFHD